MNHAHCQLPVVARPTLVRGRAVPVAVSVQVPQTINRARVSSTTNGTRAPSMINSARRPKTTLATSLKDLNSTWKIKVENLEKNINGIQNEIVNLTCTVATLSADNEELKKALNELKTKAQNEVLVRSPFPRLPFSIRILTELKDLNEKLKQDDLLYNTYEVYLTGVGGQNLESCVTNIFNKIIDRSLQAQLSLTGKRTTKESLLNCDRIFELIHAAARNNYPNYKHYMGEEIIGKILRKMQKA